MRIAALRITDVAGTLGNITAAASCPACFPALASLGSALGLGFLSGYEGLMITTVLPLLAAAAMLAHALGWLAHKRWLRTAAGMAGPAMVLAAAWLFIGNWWTAWLLYGGLASMVAVSLWQLFARLAAGDALVSVLTCPQCGRASSETMPTDSCQYFYECRHCKAVLRPHAGDCCVFCSYGTRKCPPMQASGTEAGACANCS